MVLEKLFEFMWAPFNLLGSFVVSIHFAGVTYRVSYLGIIVAGLAIAILINMLWKGGKT